MTSNPIVRSKQFSSFLGFLLLVGFVWMARWSGGIRELLRKATLSEHRVNADGTSRATPNLILLPGGKA